MPHKPFMMMAVSFLLVACSNHYNIEQDYRSHLSSPPKWQQAELPYQAVEQGWLAQLEDPQVRELVRLALTNNNALQQQKLLLDQSKQRLIVAGSALLPSLELGFDASRRKMQSIGNDFSLDLNLRYEIDLWGKLSADERKANLTLMAQSADYEQQVQSLVADVVRAWFSVIEANKQLVLLNERVVIVNKNLEIIESGYRQGLNDALDVYLTRNELNNEKAKQAAQRELQVTNIRKLERMIGQYPAGILTVSADLPLLNRDIPVGLPSELLTRKPSLQASWYQLLAADANLAYAHKQRFPSISLTAAIGPSSSEINELLSGSNLAWSLLGSLSAPLFNAGKLKANEEIARLDLAKQELVYLDAVQAQFQQVENSITAESLLLQRFKSTEQSALNAKQAELLSFEQYQKGLISYTTVLDAQKRAFDAQSSLISIKNQLIQNRIALHVALGGDFGSDAIEVN